MRTTLQSMQIMKTHFIRAFVLLALIGTVRPIEAQNLPNVIPPSPEAAGIVGYGNTGVNFYTGAPSVSVPIYTASSRGYDLPINLTYTGSGGIKVESLASWVGLGWTLNAGGAITRTIRGLADNHASGGYLNVDLSASTTGTFPDYDGTNVSFFQDYANGIKDGEPDAYHFNVNGMSGSFHFNKSKDVVLKTMSNVKITPTWGGSNSIVSFTIRDTSGNLYTFAEQEKSDSKRFGDSHTTPEETMAWYLTKIEDAFGQTLMTLTYKTLLSVTSVTQFPYTNLDQPDLSLNVFTAAKMRYTWNYTDAKRIDSIKFDHGLVKFIHSTGSRADYLNDKYLTEIQVKDWDGNIVRAFELDHSYFDDGEISPITEGSTSGLFYGKDVGDFKKRLKLDAITEWSAGKTSSKPPHQFYYHQEHFLPDRYAFSTDHWGYYNGQNSNVNPEPLFNFAYYDQSLDQQFKVFGSADKEPRADYAKAGVLQQIVYPTGGSTVFEYEGNMVIEDELPNESDPQNLDVDLNYSEHTFTIDLVNEPFAVVQLKGFNDNSRDISYIITSVNSSVYKPAVTIPYSPGSSIYTNNAELYLTEGTYKIKAQLSGSAGTKGFDIFWDDKTALTNKPAGGLRIASITDKDGLGSGTPDVKRKFSYNYNNGNSSGGLLNVPKYAFQLVWNNSTTSTPNVASGDFMRTIKATRPLLMTNGSHVGYRKVTVERESASETGKTEYYYTGPSQDSRKDFFDGFYTNTNALSGESFWTLGDLGTYETYPFPRGDDRELVRGLLEKQVDYRYVNGGFEKVREVESRYEMTFGMPFINGEEPQTPADIPTSVAVNTTNEYVDGMIHHPGSHNWFKKYRIYSGRIDKTRETERIYDLNDTTKFYEKVTDFSFLDLSSDYFTLSATTTTDSEGIVYKTENDYPFEESGTVYTDMVDDKNMIAPVIESRQYKGTTLLSTTTTNYQELGTTGNFAPSSIQTAKGTNSPETRVTFNAYTSTNGNLVSVNKDGGAKQMYLYGYDEQLPVAQVINAGSTSDIAYSSFEQDGKGGWTYLGSASTDVNSPTGTKYYDLSAGAISKANLTSSTEYVVSFFLKNGTTLPTINGVQTSIIGASQNGWTYYERVVTGITDLSISGTGDIDELRVYPVGAQMTTYTYDPLYGMTSQCDPNHRITKYIYDSFGRLQLVKDQNGHVVSANEYKYQATSSN